MLAVFFKSKVATGVVGVVGVVGVDGEVGVVGVVGALVVELFTELEIALAKADTTAWLALLFSTAVVPLLIEVEAWAMTVATCCCTDKSDKAACLLAVLSVVLDNEASGSNVRALTVAGMPKAICTWLVAANKSVAKPCDTKDSTKVLMGVTKVAPCGADNTPVKALPVSKSVPPVAITLPAGALEGSTILPEASVLPAYSPGSCTPLPLASIKTLAPEM